MSRQSVIAILLVAASAAGVQAAQRRPPPKKPEPPPSIAPLVVADMLDAYAAGRFDEAIAQITRLDDKIGRNLRAHWNLDARPWLDADPATRPHRLLVAAALALETEQVRVDRGDWGMAVGDPPCAGTCVLDWAQSLFAERGSPDSAEKAWYLAAASLVGGVRDWRYLYRGVDPNAPVTVTRGLMERAILRMPVDPMLRLEQALALAGRFSTTIDGGRLASDPLNMVIALGPGGMRASPARPPREISSDLLEALVPDPIVGAEAQMRFGYLRWALGDDVVAKRSLAQAAERTKDADVRYLSRFLLGWIAQQAGRNDEAAPEFEAALQARPDSQSAALALATVRLQQGDASHAYDTMRASIDKRKTDDDPWRLFLYGHYPRLAERIAALRAEVRR